MWPSEFARRSVEERVEDCVPAFSFLPPFLCEKCLSVLSGSSLLFSRNRLSLRPSLSCLVAVVLPTCRPRPPMRCDCPFPPPACQSRPCHVPSSVIHVRPSLLIKRYLATYYLVFLLLTVRKPFSNPFVFLCGVPLLYFACS